MLQLRPIGSQFQARAFAEVAKAPTTNEFFDELSTKIYSDEGKRSLASLQATYLELKSKTAEGSKVSSMLIPPNLSLMQTLFCLPFNILPLPVQ